MNTVEDIISPIAGDLERVEDEFSRLLKSSFPLVTGIAKHINIQRGKRLRPMLVLLSGRLCGELVPETYKAAALLELLHNATLIHDDVVDDAAIRRGNPTLNAVWKNKISVLIGDYILARLLTTALELGNLPIIKLLAETSVRMSQGEIAQLASSQKKYMTEKEYITIIKNKTASLISASCQLGALTVSASKKQVNPLKKFGEKIGLAFQIRDDVLDIDGDETVLGKQRGTDLKNGKITLPLLYTLSRVEPARREAVLKQVCNEQIGAVIRFIHTNGGIAYAQQYAVKYVKEAKDLLNIFPDSVYKTALLQLSDYIVYRDR